MKKFFLLPIIISFLLLIIGKAYPIYAAAPVGNYLVLSGGHVTATSPFVDVPSQFSFKARINPDSVNGKQIILSVGNKSTGKMYYEISINGGLLEVVNDYSYYYNYGYNVSHSDVKAGNLAAGSWQDIDVEISPAQIKLFIDQKSVLASYITNSLGPIGPDIVVGDSYTESYFDSRPFKGLMDEVQISGATNILLWHLDENRGVIVAADSSGNNINGTLIGGDSLIHFFGVLPPTPTPLPNNPFTLPTLNWTRPVLPTLSFPYPINPGPTSTQPPVNDPTPTSTSDIRNFPRPTRRA